MPHIVGLCKMMDFISSLYHFLVCTSSNLSENITLPTYVTCKVHTLVSNLHFPPHVRVIIACFCKVYALAIVDEPFS